MRLAWTLLLAAACGSDLDEVLDGGRRHLYGTVRASASGTARLKVPIDPGDAAMLITAEVPRPWAVHVRSLTDPSGTEVFQAFEFVSSDHNKTNGGFVASTATLNWPVLQADPGLAPGKWEIEFGVVDEQLEFTQQDVAVDILLKSDADLGAGAIQVAVVFTGGSEQDEELREAVRDAKEIWRELYASIGIDVQFGDDRGFAVDEVGAPAFGDEGAYREIATQTGVPHVNLVISPRITGTGLEQIFGIAGDIPGPLVPTPRSGVQISATLAAGPDGRFSDEDTRLLAETMAHESMHFLGLFHPVEATYDAWDVLGDTPECATESGCIDELGKNLMFPFPVCSVASCDPQDVITAEQAAVAHRYTGVD